MKLIANCLIAAALFAFSFLATRAIRDHSGGKRVEDIETRLSPRGANQSMLPHRQRHSTIKEQQTSREFFDRFQKAEESHDSSLRMAVIKEWAHTCPEPGISLALEKNQPALAWQLAEEWATYDDHGAISVAKKIPVRSVSDESSRRFLFDNVARARFREAPEELARFLLEFPIGSVNFDNIVFEEHLGDFDPARQARALEQISEISVRTQFAKAVLSQWARTDPEAAIQWQENHLADLDGQVMASLMMGWAANDPRAAARRLPKFDKRQYWEHLYAFENFLRGAVEKDPEFALEWAAENFNKGIESALRGIYHADGCDKVQKLSDELISRGVLTLESHTEAGDRPWPPQSADEASVWANDQFDTGWETQPRSWKVEDIQAATAFLIENPELTKRTEWHVDLSGKWAAQNPLAAIEWSATLPPELQIEAAEKALETWFDLDPKPALAFAESLPPSEFRGYAIEKIAEEWARSDPEAALEWSVSLPAGASRDRAAGRIARHLRFSQPEQAFGAAQTITDDTLRLDSLTSVIDVWSRRDSAQAETFLRQAALSDADRNSLLDRLPQR